MDEKLEGLRRRGEQKLIELELKKEYRADIAGVRRPLPQIEVNPKVLCVFLGPSEDGSKHDIAGHVLDSFVAHRAKEEEHYPTSIQKLFNWMKPKNVLPYTMLST